MEHYFINGRYIKSSLLYKAIEEAYKPYMMQHMYPFVVLQITVEPELLDVNVHPTKMDVRFGNGELVYQNVYHAVNEALSKREMIPNVSIADVKKETLLRKKRTESIPEPFEVKRQQTQQPSIWEEWKYQEPISDKKMEELQKLEQKIADSLEKQPSRVQEERTQETEIEIQEKEIKLQENETKPQELPESSQIREQQAVKEEEHSYTPKTETPIKETKEPTAAQQTLFETSMLSKPARSEHRMIGQLFDTYWLVEYQDHLYIIDKHAAHEKVLYEKTMRSLKTREYTSQQISPPIILTLTPQEQVSLSANQK